MGKRRYGGRIPLFGFDQFAKNNKLHDKINKDRYSVTLIDDGTLDTVIVVNGQEYRYDTEFASQFRSKKTGAITKRGWASLKRQAIQDYKSTYE